jgi:hypothetical protein
LIGFPSNSHRLPEAALEVKVVLPAAQNDGIPLIEGVVGLAIEEKAIRLLTRFFSLLGVELEGTATTLIE